MSQELGMRTETVTSADGTRIATERVGSGPALVFVDGAMCHRDFGPARPLAAALADRFTVVYYDRRGRGESGNTLPYAPEREIEDLQAVIESAGGHPYVAGQSSGAALVFRAAAAGVPMRKIASYEAPWVGLRKDRQGNPRDYLGELQRLVDAGERGKAVDYFVVKMVGGPRMLPVVLRLARSVWKQLQAVAHTLPYDTQVMGTDFNAPLDELAGIKVPTLVMVGSKAKKEMAEAQKTIANTVPDTKYLVLDKQSHQVTAAALRAPLLDFFTE